MEECCHIQYKDGDYLLVKDDWRENIKNPQRHWHGFQWLSGSKNASILTRNEAAELIAGFWPGDKPPAVIVPV